MHVNIVGIVAAIGGRSPVIERQQNKQTAVGIAEHLLQIDDRLPRMWDVFNGVAGKNFVKLAGNFGDARIGLESQSTSAVERMRIDFNADLAPRAQTVQ